MDDVLKDIETGLQLEARDYTYEQVKHDLEGVKKARDDTDNWALQFYLTFVISVLENILKSKEAPDGED